MKEPDQVTPAKANEHLFSKEQVNCTKQEYHERGVRDAIDLFRLRQKDFANKDLEAHAEAEMKRLDELHGPAPF